MSAPLDSFTILTTKGPLATKRVVAVPGGPPKIEGYGKAQRFSFDELPLSGFDDMADALKALQPRSRSFIVRGKPADGINRKDAPRRLHARKLKNGTIEPATLVAQPRFWLPLDLDSVPCPAGIDPIWEPDAVVEHVIELLPEEFHGVSVFWAFTSGHGIKPGIRLRLFYWLDRPLADWEIKVWLAKPIAEGLIDPVLYHPIQATYTAAPIFVGMTDPVPHRCSTWTGYADAVEVPVIERPKARTAGRASGTNPGGSNPTGELADIAAALDVIPNLNLHWEDWNRIGLAIWRATGGSDAGKDLFLNWSAKSPKFDEGAVDERWDNFAAYPPTEIGVGSLFWEARQAYPGWQKPSLSRAAEPCEPTYPEPLGSVEAARDVLARAMDRFAEVALTWEPPGKGDADVDEAEPGVQPGQIDLNPTPDEPPPLHTVNAEIGTGKTRAWRERVAPRLIAAEKRPVLAVPRHNLGDEIMRDLAEAGITARVFRGREAADPNAPGKTMCRDLERVRDIEAAGGRASAHACEVKILNLSSTLAIFDPLIGWAWPVIRQQHCS